MPDEQNDLANQRTEALRHLVAEAGGLRELSKQAGLSYETLRRFLSAGVTPSYATARKLDRVAGSDVFSASLPSNARGQDVYQHPLGKAVLERATLQSVSVAEFLSSAGLSFYDLHRLVRRWPSKETKANKHKLDALRSLGIDLKS